MLNPIAIATATAPVTVVKVNGNAGAIVAGTPVYVKSATQYDKARANAASTAGVLGLQKESSIAAGANGTIQTAGILTLTTAQWDAIFGTSGGLAYGAIYYLSADTAGLATATSPTTAGQYTIQLGRAISPTEFNVRIRISVLL